MQSVNIMEATSVILELLLGVPQGSVLGLLLFLIYIPFLHHLIKFQGLSVHGYAVAIDTYLFPRRPNDPV